MTGANYMGGKRNAAKTRSKDSTGRIQRGFFGRQRLNMLSKGIPRRTPGSPRDQRPSIPIIELAHAPQGPKDLGTLGRFDMKSSNKKRAMTSVPVPKTPESRGAKASSSSGGGRSRVLDVLDTEEPMFVRATLNRILNLPDLAGLSGTSHACKLIRVEDEYTRDECKRKKTASPSNDDSRVFHTQPSLHSSSISSPCDPYTRLSGNRDCANTQSMGDGLHTPPEVSNHSQLSGPVPSLFYSKYSRGVSSSVSSLPPSSEQSTSSDFATGATMDFDDQDWDDSGFNINFERQHWTPSPQARYERYSSRSIAGVPSQDEDDDEIVAFNRSRRQCPRFAENNLYDHLDPWHTIGVILGLSPVRPDDCLLDGASKDQIELFARTTQPLTENKDQNLGMNEDVPGSVQCWESDTQLDSLPFWAAGDGFKDDFDEPIGVTPGSSCDPRQQISPLLLIAQDGPEEKKYDVEETAMDINSDDLSPGSVQSVEPQSPFRILLESKRSSASSVHNRNSRSSEVSGSLAPPPSSGSPSQSSPIPRTLSPGGIEETQSPFRMLFAARNLDQNQKKVNLNLTEYSLGDSDVVGPLSSPGTVTFDSSNSTVLREIDGIFEGPCLFPDDADDEYDTSDEDCPS